MLNRRKFVTTATAYSFALTGCKNASSASIPPVGPVPSGVNLESGGWGYWPMPSYYNYYLDKKFKYFRLCFNWPKMQPKLGGDLAPDLLKKMDEVIDYLTVLGATVILDQHDYMLRDGQIIGQSAVTNAHYANLWKHLAYRYKGNKNIWFGLMNEPHDVDVPKLAQTLNLAITTIRAAGANNVILCPGTDWCNGERWLKSGNDHLADMITPDPALYFEVHQYLDEWGRGQNPVAQPGSGRRLEAVTEWARATNRKLFLGEFSAGPDPDTLKELAILLDTLARNRDVWMGYCYWSSGGGMTSDRWYSLDPLNGKDRPQMGVLAAVGKPIA